jgi:hypothetical protein
MELVTQYSAVEKTPCVGTHRAFLGFLPRAPPMEQDLTEQLIWICFGKHHTRVQHGPQEALCIVLHPPTKGMDCVHHFISSSQDQGPNFAS